MSIMPSFRLRGTSKPESISRLNFETFFNASALFRHVELFKWSQDSQTLLARFFLVGKYPPLFAHTSHRSSLMGVSKRFGCSGALKSHVVIDTDLVCGLLSETNAALTGAIIMVAAYDC